MKPTEVYGNESLRTDDIYQEEYDTIKDKDCIVALYFHNSMIIKMFGGYYALTLNNKFNPHQRKTIEIWDYTLLFGYYNNQRMKFKDEKLYKEFEEWLLIQQI